MISTQIQRWPLLSFFGLALISTISVLLAFKTEAYYIALLPFVVLLVLFGINNFKFLYYLLLFSIPFSVEYSFTSSLGTDLPDEPLMVGLMFVTFIYLLQAPKSLPRAFFIHPLFVLLSLHFFWTLITSFTSVAPLVSFKLFFSKLWYVTTFVVLSAIVLKTQEDVKRAFWCIYIPLTLLIIQVIVRHALVGFSFDDINKPMPPFFRNHVNYAAIVALFIPFIWMARGWYKPSFTKKLLTASIVLYVVAIYLSYTRTCYLALLLIPPFVWLLKNKLMKPALLAAFVLLTSVVSFLMYENKFMDFAPEFEQTTMHDEFGDHLSSTFEGKDVSSMERVYRWIAIAQMWKDKPVFGFGPGNFYPNYMSYTILSFETYVSDNEERSTAHNYFLLLLAEQGVPGVLFFILLTAAIFIWCEKTYHRTTHSLDKRLVMMVSVVLMISYVNLMLSDLLESDKLGPFFFIALSILIALDIRTQLLKPQTQ